MKLPLLLTTRHSALLAGVVLALVPMAASAGAVLWIAPGQLPSGESANPTGRTASVFSLEATVDGPSLSGGEAAPFGNLSAFSTAPLSAVAGSNPASVLPLAPEPAADTPADAVELWMNGAIVRRFEATTPARWNGAPRTHGLRSESDPDGFIANIFMTENGLPVDLFSATAGGYLDGLPLRGLVPVPEPTTALFGLALVGFCALARYGPRAKAGQD